MKKWWIIGIISFIVIVGIILALVFIGKNKNTDVNSKVAGTMTTAPSYFSEDAKVMYFYSDSCHWCIEEKKVLDELASEGYKVKAMDVGRNADYWTKYNISGTPTFISISGVKHVGYMDKASLKTFLDQNK